MQLFDGIQILLFIGVGLGCVPLFGSYMAKVFRGEITWMHHLLQPLEKLSYQLTGVNPQLEMGWKSYLRAMLLFNLVGILILFVDQLMQHVLPFNPQNFEAVSWDVALNTAISFVTNTNWQAYSGETTLSYGTQMWGLTVQNFLSAATGNAALLALVRGIVKKEGETVGNFWVDLVRTVVYVLLPCAFILALLLIGQGVVQTLSPYLSVTTLEKSVQILPFGPAASQVAIKQLGTNGGGFFGTNSAHPFENPTPLSNFLEVLAIVILPASATYMYGVLTGRRRHGWLLLCVMFLFWAGTLALSLYSENVENPLFKTKPLLEGKETRLGVAHSILWSVTTSATSNGSVNTMLDSLSPLAGGAALFNILLGELIFGGVGVGLCSMLMFVLLTIFLSGLMVGRTPEYMGKKIGKLEMQWVSAAILVPGALILIGASLASLLPSALASLKNQGPHGLSELLYAFASSSGNNGSAFSGLNADLLFYNLILACIMLLARLAILVPSLAIAGCLVRKRAAPLSKAIFSTETFLFATLLVGVVFIVGALTFFPALCLGPIVEHFLMKEGVSF